MESGSPTVYIDCSLTTMIPKKGVMLYFEKKTDLVKHNNACHKIFTSRSRPTPNFSCTALMICSEKSYTSCPLAPP